MTTPAPTLPRKAVAAAAAASAVGTQLEVRSTAWESSPSSRQRIYGEFMQDEAWVTDRADGRAVLTNAADPDTLGRIVAGWPMPTEVPVGVTQLWERACGQFRSGWVSYENFTDAVRTGFEAVDAALRNHVGDLLVDGKRRTLRPLIDLANDHGRLTPRQYEWLSVYALRFRNRLTHADGAEPLVLTPGMAAEMMEGIARFVAELGSDSTS